MSAESPFSAAVLAASAPAGPPPITSTSYLLFIHNLQGTKGADLCTDSAARAVLFHGQIGIDQFEGAFGADRYAAAAISTNIPTYVEH
jgi:hypothetical protein